MARFKFGKKKKDNSFDPEVSVDSDNTSIEDKSIKQHQLQLTPNNKANSPLPVPPASAVQSSTVPQMVTTSTPSPHIPDASHQFAQSAVETPWTKYKLKNSPFPRYRHSASTVSSEKNEIFLMGGLKEGSVFGDTWKITPVVTDASDPLEVEEYVAQNIIISNKNNPPARVGHSSVLIGNAYIIYGGDTVDTDFNGFPDNNFYLFNINNSKYTIPSHILNKPNGRYGHTIGVVSLNSQSSRLYLFGGQLENDVFNDLYYFELNTFKSPKARWNLVEPLNNFRPPPLTNHTMSIYKNKIYIFGGVYNNEKVSNDLWCFDIPSSKWTQVSTSGNIPLPVNEHSACIINDKLYIYGGNDFSGIIYNSLYILDLHTLVWSKLTTEGEVNGPGSRCGHTMTYIPNLNKVLIMGGDKNDYVSNDPRDYETYETKGPNTDSDTMIYQLDLAYVDDFLSSRKTVVKAKKSSATPPVNAGLGSPTPTPASPVQAHASIPGPAPAMVPVAAASAVNAGPELVSGANTDLRHSFQRHARSVSNGPEDFRTPEASPERKQEQFVEVPSSAVSERNIATDLDDAYVHKEVPLPNLSGSENGHSFGVTPPPSSRSVAPVSETPAASAPVSNAENEKVKKLVGELTAELATLRQSAKLEMQNATEKINSLEQENQRLRELDAQKLQSEVEEKDEIISQLRQQIDPSLISIDEENENAKEPTNSPITQLTKYKLERLELNNKLVYLTQENKKLNQKLVEFEPFMNNQIGELSNFQKIINKQEEKIAVLSSQVKDQEALNKELNNWKSKHENLQLEFNNFKSIHEDIDISDDEKQPELEEPNGVDSTNRSILSNSTTRKSKKDISNHLESLVNAWNSKSSSRSIAAGDSESGAVDPMVLELQKQLDDLMTISKEQEVTAAREIANLKQQLATRSEDLKTYEANYKDALQSVNNTSKALKLTQEELRNQKVLMEKLIAENNELNLYKKASKRSSTRAPIQNNQEFNSTLKDVDEEDDDIENAHFNMKIKDLEADLFILKQERDSLKESVTNLQKQLYLSQT